MKKLLIIFLIFNFSLANSTNNKNFDFEKNTDSVKYYNSKLAKIWDNLYNKNLEKTVLDYCESLTKNR